MTHAQSPSNFPIHSAGELREEVPPRGNHAPPSEKEDQDYYESEGDLEDLLGAASRLRDSDAAINFGSERQKFLPSLRVREIAALALEAQSPCPPSHEPTFVGGEHEVFECEQKSAVFKQTLTGFYGRIMDEVSLLDPTTFQNRRQLTLRTALPSEYLRRWAITYAIFGLPTKYVGCDASSGTLKVAVYQPYIEQDDADPATLEDVNEFMTSHGFIRVEGRKIAIPEVREVTWYRQKDGILIADAHARNFRKDAGSGALIPVDLMVSVVPKGVSEILPEPDCPWSGSEMRI